MTAIRVAIVDDEPLARQRIRRLLLEVGQPDFEVVQEHASTRSLLAGAKEAALDLLFLDIEMPGGDGFSALKQWPGAPPLVVFVTAYEQHGVKAFDARATDYLLKPVSAERLAEALAKVREVMAMRALPPVSRAPKRIALPIGQRTDLVAVTDIDLVVASGNYLEIHAGTRSYVVRKTLSALQVELDDPQLLRIHRSCIVRSTAVHTIKPLGSGRFWLELQGGRKIHSGRSYRPQVAALLATSNTA